MSTPGHHGPFAADFMDDYFAEADEHLVAVGRGLLALEATIGSGVPAAVLEDLFRSFHSLKGISAMVELREAELLAHHMESCLRALRQGSVTVTSEIVDALVTSTRMLEGVVGAARAGTPPPTIEPVIETLVALSRRDSVGVEHGHKPALAAPAPASTSGRLWRVTFLPSPDLVERGIKVDTVRARMLEIGQVLNVVPKVVPGGGIAFEFDVRTDDEAQLDRWREDGLTYEALGSSVLASDASLQDAKGRMPGEPASSGPANVVRVDLSRLDDLMRLVGDMVVTRSRLHDTLQRVEPHVPAAEWRALQEHNSGIERQLRDLREGVMRVRLVPIGEIFRRMPFVVRDLARDTGTRVTLELAGQDTEIDKFLIERMMDPVLHLVRNAITHGIETPGQRIAAGKPPDGTIRLSASTVGETVLLEIADDGAGIDVEAVARRAHVESGAIPDLADERALLDVICASGFSTRDEADRGSGRGVGMAVVRDTVQQLGGTLALETRAGRGTTFRITLPLTLAITDAIIAHVSEHVFAVPQAAVREVIEVDAASLRTLERNQLMPYRGSTLPMVRLSDLFSLTASPRQRLHAIVVGTGLAAIGLLVDRIAGQREVVVKAITDPLIRVDGVSGATELGDGRLVLILDVSALSRALRYRPRVMNGVPA
jgi:two-component system chemotaxis sensor kinase CheA